MPDLRLSMRSRRGALALAHKTQWGSMLGSRGAGHHWGPRLWEEQLNKLDGAQGEPKEGVMKAPR